MAINENNWLKQGETPQQWSTRTGNALNTSSQGTGVTTIDVDSLKPTIPLKIPTITENTTNLTNTAGGVSDSLTNDLTGLTTKRDATSTALENDSNSIISAMEQLTSKTADTKVAEEQAGVNKEVESLNKYVQQLTDLNAQASALNREAQAIPLQTQENNRNTGATDRGVAPQDAGALRLNAIKALSIAQQADITLASATGSELRLQAARDKAQQIVDLKYKPLEDALAIKTKQYELNKDLLERVDKKRTEALTVALAKEAKELEKAKAEDTAKSNLMLELAKKGVSDSAILTSIRDAKTLEDAIQLAAPSLKELSTDIVKLDNGNTILIDKNTGKVIKSFGGSKPSESTTIPTSAPENIKGLASFGDLIGGFSSVNAQKMFQKNLSSLAAQGDSKGIAEKIVRQSIDNISTADIRKRVDGGFRMSEALVGIGDLLEQYERAGGKTNLLKGTSQKVKERLGTLGDKDLANIGLQITVQMDNLARARTGAVINPSEEELYRSMLPSTSNYGELNDVKIRALRTSLMGDVENQLRYDITSDGLNAIKAELPQLFDYNDTFLDSFSTNNINKSQDNKSFFNSIPYPQ